MESRTLLVCLLAGVCGLVASQGHDGGGGGGAGGPTIDFGTGGDPRGDGGQGVTADFFDFGNFDFNLNTADIQVDIGLPPDTRGDSQTGHGGGIVTNVHTSQGGSAGGLFLTGPYEPAEVSSQIILRNPGINVPFGREKVIDPNTELNFYVREGDRCTVTVLQNDHLAQVPGRVHPYSFPCDFAPGEVKYIHFGSRSPQRDRIQMQVRYDTDTDTYIIPFMMNVNVQSTQLEIVTRNQPLIVENLMGRSDVLDQRKLEFYYDTNRNLCKVTVLNANSGLPRYGRVLNANQYGQMVDCENFLASNIQYEHRALTDSPRADYIPMVVELTDLEGNLLKQEYFQVMVRINAGLENTPPMPSLTAMMILEVDQFVMTAITPEILAAEDTETNPDALIFNITTPLGPGEGYIVSTDDRNLPLSSFSQQDVRNLKIAYVPPAEDSNVQRYFQIELEVVDAELATSEPFALMVTVKPKNTMAPVATRNTGISLFEGQSRPLLNFQNLQISDEDNLRDVIIAPINGLRHGQLRVRGVPQKFFTIDDLEAGVVTYHHDGTDTYSDNIIFRMTDGSNEVEFLFPVTVAPLDDEPPVVNVNTGLLINKGDLSQITQFVLSATDIDSDDSTIMFMLEPPFSNQGDFVIRQLDPPADPQNWRQIGGFYEQTVTEWLLDDILNNRLYYRHNGVHSTDIVMDRMLFRVADKSDPPNVSAAEEFVVKIMPVDDQPPYLYPGTTLEMSVDEFELSTILKKQLRYTDLDSDDRELVYTITMPPFDIDPQSPLPAGQIVLTEDPGTPITQFKQSQINHLKIAYQPPSIELGITSRVIQFVYAVSDPAGNIVSGQRFSIYLRPVDNKPPRVTNPGFSVYERNKVTIDPTILDATDEDTENSDISFVVVQPPQQGTITLDGIPMQPGDRFNLDDIANNRIEYVNSGAEMDNDVIELELTDGVHIVPVTIYVDVRPIDDEAPTLDLPPGTLGSFLEVPEDSSSLITSNILSASDPDTEDLRLTFILDRPPSEGVIENNGFPVQRFTQQDIVNGYIRYRHIGGEIGLVKRDDSFNLTLSDMSDEWIRGGNRITQVEVFVTILPVDNRAPEVTIGDQYYVDEGEKGTITLDHLSATDLDTNDDDIMCTVVVQPTQGYLENISPAPGSEKSRSGIPITAFSVKDLRLNHINYVQSIREGVEPEDDQFTVYCSDGINRSPNHFFPININPTNDEPPQMFYREWTVDEGGELNIDTPILNAIDNDIPRDELHFYIITPPQFGTIIQRRPEGDVPVLNFTLEQIQNGNDIVYQHDDSETTEDSIKILLTDGTHEVTEEIPIYILQRDDETPRMTINDGLDLEIGEMAIITNRILKATDLDSSDSNLTYTIRFGPERGLLQRLDKFSGIPIQNITVGMNFTQWEIDNQRIKYTHTSNEGGRDLIKFDVTDGENPLIDRYFYVTVDHIDNVYPDVINAGVTLQEHGRVTLTTDVISTSDLNSPDENLLFTITESPNKGHLESTDNPGVPITSFTQLELAGNKIVYVHTSPDEMRMDSFQFQVTDGFNTVIRTFRISLSEVDNKLPAVTYTSLALKEGDNKLITPFELRIDDRDTDDSLLKFTITQLPLHGNILFNKTKLVTMFTMADLYNNLISYQHDGTETGDDSFSFIISDGTHNDFIVMPNADNPTRKPQKMRIEIVPVDNGIPQIVVNRWAPTLNLLPSGNQGFVITNKFLRAEDRDSVDGDLLYIITTPPSYGYLMNVLNGNISISNFTQDDLNNMYIQYVLYPGQNATGDTFFFSIRDAGGNELPNQPYQLNWSWISLDREYYEVNETTRHLSILLRRRGYLGETSFVGIRAVDGTAKAGEDFNGKKAQQVQFNPGQTEGFWRVRILDDTLFEQAETFEVILHDAVMGSLEYPEHAIVKILDGEDESTVFIDVPDRYVIEEDIGELLIPIRRTGDLSEELMMICSTMPDTAIGSNPSPVLSYMDYISRMEEDPENFIRFDKGEDVAYCRVTIIDDSLYEPEEQFQVKLTMPMGGRIGTPASIDVIIAADADDEPSFYFTEPEYHVDESDGYLEVQVWRTGTDLSQMASVTVRSRKSTPISAVSGEDYAGISRNLDFAPGVTMQTVRVYILDDLGQPLLEGPETFELVLTMPMNAVLGKPAITVVTINDTISDLPKVQFRNPSYDICENDGTVSAIVVRSGDLSISSTVRCYTRQGSAQVMMDYDERPNTEASIVTFLPGERQKECTVLLMNDNEYEPGNEQFRLVLNHPRTESGFPAMVGELNETTINVCDEGDKPIIKFPQTKFSIDEPTDPDGVSIVRIPIIRMGDSSQTSVVRVHTKDGSAKSGLDYNPLSQRVTFGWNVTEQIIEIEVLPDDERNEMREAFTVHITMDENMIAEVQMNRALVYIEQEGQVTGVTFPSTPIVVSLLDYDNIDGAQQYPPRGYPLVCVTPCNPKHPEYSTTGQICDSENVNDTLTEFRWMVAAPTTDNGVTYPLKEINSNTFFTSTHMTTLDSIYYGPGSRVSCVARAVSNYGDPGREHYSLPVTISTEEGMCLPRIADAIGAEPYNARLRYTGPGDPDHPNKIKLTVTMPHVDGMLPVISTRQLANFELALSPDGLRVGTHRCSNLLDFNELPTQYGFISEETKNPNVIGEVVPYQFNQDLRGASTLRFYRNLDLEACLWEFDAYYDMSELLDECGGIVGTDGQVLDLVQSYVTLRVPLYVSYVFHSPAGIGGWQHFDQRSDLQLTFVYDTSILWQNGIGAQTTDSTLSGSLYPTSMRIDENGRLVVNFRTDAQFRGLFVPDHPATDMQSSVTSSDQPGLTYTLTLLRSQPTFAQPEQLWQFVSDHAVSDYSGNYVIRLIPCTTMPNQEYSAQITCNPQEKITFDLPIRFQQVSDPVPAEYSLNTEFLLLGKEMLWLSDGNMGFGDGADAAFAPGDEIYGRIHVDPVQNLGDGFNLNIEKVFLCSGRDGYIPKYNPQENEYGCVADTPNLLYAFKILDRGAPDTITRSFSGIPFNATLAIDNPKALPLVQQSGADGFSMGSNALFQVSSGRQWYLHSIYTVESANGNGIGKRSVMRHSIMGAPNSINRRRRQAPEYQQLVSSIGDAGLGTNIHRVALKNDRNDIVNPYGDGKVGKGANSAPVVPVVAVITVLALCLLIIIIVVVVMRRRRVSSTPNPPVTVVACNGGAKVVASHPMDEGDNTEV